MSFFDSFCSTSFYPNSRPVHLPVSHLDHVKFNSPYTLEAKPENLEKCIQSKDPFSFKFSTHLDDPSYSFMGKKGLYDVYSPIEYAIKINDSESLKRLLDLPDSSRYFSVADVCFYMERLDVFDTSNHVFNTPNLEVLKLLLDHVQDINAKVVDRERVTRNLMDYLIYRMGEIQKLYVDVMEELLARGAEDSDISRPILFELLESRGHASILKAFTGQPNLVERVIQCIKVCPTYLDFEENSRLRFDFRWSVVQRPPVSDSELDCLTEFLPPYLREITKKCLRESVERDEESSFNPRLECMRRDIYPNFGSTWV